MKPMALFMVLFYSAIINSSAFAEEEGMVLSYAQVDADKKIAETVDAMQAWAEGEYREHEGEGLFKKYPKEGLLLQEMTKVAKQLQVKAEAAKQAGELDKARAYYFSAEATAQYVARMPHMLEQRLKIDK